MINYPTIIDRPEFIIDRASVPSVDTIVHGADVNEKCRKFERTRRSVVYPRRRTRRVQTSRKSLQKQRPAGELSGGNQPEALASDRPAPCAQLSAGLPAGSSAGFSAGFSAGSSAGFSAGFSWSSAGFTSVGPAASSIAGRALSVTATSAV